MRYALAAVAWSLVGCHLADDIDAPRCPAGTHPELQRCVADETTEKHVTIRAAEGGTSCSGDPSAQRPPIVEPAVFHVKAREDFQFDNRDVVPHVVTGPDGQQWVTVPSGGRSVFMNVARAGTFAYSVSGCAMTATVVVE